MNANTTAITMTPAVLEIIAALGGESLDGVEAHIFAQGDDEGVDEIVAVIFDAKGDLIVEVADFEADDIAWKRYQTARNVARKNISPSRSHIGQIDRAGIGKLEDVLAEIIDFCRA